MSKELFEFEKTNESIYKKNDAVDFIVEITQKGVDEFYKENYPSMKLELNDNRFYIKGFYNQGEEHFITSYFISFGKQLLSITPEVLRNSIIKTLGDLESYYNDIF